VLRVINRSSAVEDQKIAACGSSYIGTTYILYELPKAAIF
jgi:hypothetical protein